jgi:ectoine hydroxylase-related dioxygenase (phytanoyl-CoA dioxygenase family)
MEIQAAIDHLELYGYCVLADAIPAEQADRMAETYFNLHRDPANRAWFQNAKDELYQTLFGLMNLDELCWGCAAHPQVLAVVRHFLGPDTRLAEACSKWVKPGAPAGGVHVDSAHDLPARLPEAPWMINTMWMVTDFTAENGATLVAPFSHRARQRPPKGMDPADKRLMPVTGRRGSVFLWHGGIWHANGANTTTDQQRMGLNIAYYPPWWNLAREGGHQPIRPDVYARMPAELQKLNQNRVAATRAELYEAR